MTHLDEVEGYVNVESRLVTFKWLATALDIPPSTAKRVLHEFVKKHSDHVLATYAISGRTKDGVHKVMIVKDLEAGKAKFDLVTSVHVYSVQPPSSGEGLALMLSAVEYEKPVSTKYMITCASATAAVHRTSSTLGAETLQIAPKAASKPAVKSGVDAESKSKAFFGAAATTAKKPTVTLATSSTAAPATVKPEAAAKAGIQSMFQKSAAKSEQAKAVKPETTPTAESVAVKSEPAAPKSRLKKRIESDDEDDFVTPSHTSPAKPKATESPSKRRAIDIDAEPSLKKPAAPIEPSAKKPSVTTFGNSGKKAKTSTAAAKPTKPVVEKKVDKEHSSDEEDQHVSEGGAFNDDDGEPAPPQPVLPVRQYVPSTAAKKRTRKLITQPDGSIKVMFVEEDDPAPSADAVTSAPASAPNPPVPTTKSESDAKAVKDKKDSPTKATATATPAAAKPKAIPAAPKQKGIAGFFAKQ